MKKEDLDTAKMLNLKIENRERDIRQIEIIIRDLNPSPLSFIGLDFFRNKKKTEVRICNITIPSNALTIAILKVMLEELNKELKEAKEQFDAL